MTLHYTLLPDGRLRVLVDRHGAPLGPPDGVVQSAMVATAVTTAPALPVRTPRLRRVRYCTGSETEKVHCRTLVDAEYDAERTR